MKWIITRWNELNKSLEVEANYFHSKDEACLYIKGKGETKYTYEVQGLEEYNTITVPYKCCNLLGVTVDLTYALRVYKTKLQSCYSCNSRLTLAIETIDGTKYIEPYETQEQLNRDYLNVMEIVKHP